MSFECAARAAPDCIKEDLFDPAYRDEDGAAICLPCGRYLELDYPEPEPEPRVDEK